MTDLINKKCVPCEGGEPTLTLEEIEKFMKELDKRWEVIGNPSPRLTANFQSEDFKEAMAFVNKVADLAEQEGHHPDISISYSKVDITIWTHKIGGLSENDFILGAKIDDI